MLLRRTVLLLGLFSAASFGLSTSLQAAEFANGLVPMDVVREFAGGPVSPGLPSGFPPMNLPADLNLRLIGSMEQNEYSQRVLLRTSLSREAITERLRAILTVHGWIEFPPSFLSAPYLRLCHEQYGQMTINSNASGNETRVDVSRQFHPAMFGAGKCAEQQTTLRNRETWSSFYNSQFPVLEVPPTTDVPSAGIFRGGSSSSSGDGSVSIERDSTIKVPDTTVAALHERFAGQMQQQGWTADSNVKGTRSTSSVWFKTVAAPGLATQDVEMVATLTLVQGSGAAYGVQLQLQSLPKESDTPGLIGIGFL